MARQICDEALHMHLPSDPPEMPLLTGHASCCFELGMHRNAPSAEQDFQNLCSSKTLSSLMYCMYFYNPIVSEIFSVRRIGRELFSKFPPYWKPISCGFPKSWRSLSWRSKIKLLAIKLLDRDIANFYHLFLGFQQQCIFATLLVIQFSLYDLPPPPSHVSYT